MEREEKFVFLIQYFEMLEGRLEIDDTEIDQVVNILNRVFLRNVDRMYRQGNGWKDTVSLLKMYPHVFNEWYDLETSLRDEEIV